MVAGPRYNSFEMRTKLPLLAGLLLAPVAGVTLGLWAEFADLSPAVLLAVALPAIIVATLSAGVLLRAVGNAIAVVLAGLLAGVVTFGVTEGMYLAVHRLRGGFLNFEAFDSQGEMAAALLGIHLGVGAVTGLGVGTGLALLLPLARRLDRRAQSA